VAVTRPRGFGALNFPKEDFLDSVETDFCWSHKTSSQLAEIIPAVGTDVGLAKNTA
jgi:hypothetical protein